MDSPGRLVNTMKKRLALLESVWFLVSVTKKMSESRSITKHHLAHHDVEVAQFLTWLHCLVCFNMTFHQREDEAAAVSEPMDPFGAFWGPVATPWPQVGVFWRPLAPWCWRRAIRFLAGKQHWSSLE